MLSNDKDLKKFVRSLIDRDYRIDLVEVKLFLDQELFEGKGYLFLDDEGLFKLRFFSNRVYTQTDTLKAMVLRHNSGNAEGYSVSEYYRLEGSDRNGVVYTSKKLTAHFGIDNVATLSLQSTLVSSEEDYVSRIVFVGKYELPENRMMVSKSELHQTFGYTDNLEVWEIKLDQGPILVLSVRENYMDLVIVHKDPIDFEMVDAIANALDFVLGVETEMLYANLRGVGIKMYNRRNILQAKSTFSAPLVSNHRYGDAFTENHNHLFRCYLQFLLSNPGARLSKIHKTIVSGSRNYIYAAGLTLSVQIENMCREYFLSYYKPDLEFLKTLDESIALIAGSEIKGKDDFVKRLAHMRPAKGRSGANVTNILNNLALAGKLDKKLVGDWKKMRNAAAHGDNDDNDWNEFFANFYSCTNLYYQLVFALVGYSGKYSFKDYRKGNELREYPIPQKEISSLPE